MGVRHRACGHRTSPTLMRLLLPVAMVVFTAILFAACGSAEEPVVGAWKAVSTTGPRTDGTLFNRRSTVEFFEDGTLDLEGKSARWNWSTDDRLRIEFPEGAYLLEAVFDREALMLRDRGFGGNTVITFARDLSKKPPPGQ